MLENIASISECEDFFKKQGLHTHISFIGQLELTEEDTEKLQGMLCSQIRRDAGNGLDYVLNFAPSCLVFLLVNKAIWDYRQGQYWSLDKAILNIRNTALQNKLGNLFLEYISENNLKHIEIEGAHRFVGSILLHAGIPQSCLQDFFGGVIIPLLKMGVASPTEVKSFLAKIRLQNSKRLEILNEIKKLENELNYNSSKNKQLDDLIELRQKNDDYSDRLRNHSNLHILSEDLKGYRTIKHKELLNIQKEIERWNKQRLIYEATIDLFRKKEQTLFDSLPSSNIEIEKLQQFEEQDKKRSILIESINKVKQQLATEVIDIFQLPPELESEIVFHPDKVAPLFEAYCKLKYEFEIAQSRKVESGKWIKRLLQFIMRLFSSKRNTPKETIDSDRMLELRKNIEEIFREAFDSPLKEEFFSHSYEEFSAIAQTIAEFTARYNQCLRELHITDQKIKELTSGVSQIATALEWGSNGAAQLRNKLLEAKEFESRRRNACLARIKLDKIVIPTLEELARRKQSIEMELQEKERIIREFGKGDLETGILTIQRLRHLQHAKEKVIRKIEKIEKSLQIKPDSENDTLARLNRETSAQISELRRRISFRKKELSFYQKVYPYIDEPVRRFIIYGGDWAQDFIVESVKLVKLASSGQLANVRSLELPERVITWFEQWWRGENQEVQRIGPKGERLVAPALILDPVYKKLKLAVGKERLYCHAIDSFQSLSLTVTAAEDTAILAKTNFRAYSDGKGFVETLPVEINIDTLKKSYRLEIYLNDTILRSWRINGLGPNEYFLVFSEDGKKQDVNKLRKARYWLIAHAGVVLDPALHIIEEAQIDFVDMSYRMVLADLTAANYLRFTDSNGDRHRVSIQEWNHVMPEFEGGAKIPNVLVEGAPVYSEKLPTIKIPLSEKNDLSYWLLMIENEKGQHVIRSSVSIIKEVEIDKGSSNARLNLNDQFLLGSLDAGLYSIILYYLEQEVKTYRLAYIPGFGADFEKCIYPPQEKDTVKEVKIVIAKPPGTELVVHQPAKKLHEEDNTCSVVTDFHEESFSCDMKIAASTGEPLVFPMTISIPKLKWRLLGCKGKEFLEWSDSLKEFWFGEWQKADSIVLEVLCPDQGGKRLQLYIGDYRQELTLPLYEGKAQFKLTSFSDSIRNSDSAVQVFNINILEDRKKIRLGPVFRVRSKWEVYGFTYSVKKENQGYSLELQWMEKGKPERRVVRFWRLDEPWREPYAHDIPDGLCSIVLDHIEDCLSEGRYLINFDIEDPWNPRSIEFPAQDYNIFILDISYGEMYLSNCSIRIPDNDKAVIAGEFFNAPALIKTEVSLLGIRDGSVLAINAESPVKGGKFSTTLKIKDLIRAAHWLSIEARDKTSYYRIMALVEGASLEWPIGEDREFIEQLIGLSNVSLKLVYSDKDSSKSFELKELTKPILTRLLERRDFILDSKYPVRETKLHWAEDERQVYLDLPTGVVCNTCGRFFENQSDWYAHNPFSSCKSLTVRVNTVKAQLLCCLGFGEVYNQLFNKYPMAKDNAVVLFDSISKPFSSEFGPNALHGLKPDDLVKLLLQREIELCKKLKEVLKSEP